MATATELEERAAKLVADGQAIAQKATDENRDLTAEELEQSAKMLADIRAYKKTADVLKGLAEENEHFSKRKDPIAGRPGTDGAADAPPQVDRRSIGQRFVESEEWIDFRTKVAPHGFSDKGRVGASPVLNFRSLLPRREERATLLTGGSDTSAGAFVFNDVQPGYYPQGLNRPLTIRDVITVGQTNSDTVEYVTMTSQTNNAATIAEATTYGGTTSGLKPFSEFALAKVTTNVKTIAHAVAATKRALSDAGQLRTLIDSFLRYGLEEELEDQIVAGDASGENFDGIGHLSGVQAGAWNTDILTTTRKARTLVRTVGRDTPTAYLLNPADWETIDLLQDNEARYYFGGPSQMGTPRLWGLPVVESEAVPSGTGYVGNFRKCVLWEREQATIQVSDSHADFFMRNLVAILAEMRAAFGIVQPTSIVEIDLTA